MSHDLLPHEQHVWLTAFAVALDRKPLDDGHAVRQACDDYMLSNAGPSTRARAAVACQCSLVMHDQRESEGRL